MYRLRRFEERGNLIFLGAFQYVNIFEKVAQFNKLKVK